MTTAVVSGLNTFNATPGGDGFIQFPSAGTVTLIKGWGCGSDGVSGNTINLGGDGGGGGGFTQASTRSVAANDIWVVSIEAGASSLIASNSPDFDDPFLIANPGVGSAGGSAGVGDVVTHVGGNGGAASATSGGGGGGSGGAAGDGGNGGNGGVNTGGTGGAAGASGGAVGGVGGAPLVLDGDGLPGNPPGSGGGGGPINGNGGAGAAGRVSFVFTPDATVPAQNSGIFGTFSRLFGRLF